MSIIKKNIIDDLNLPPLLKAIFSIVEDTYLRKKKYKEDMAALEARMEILETLINYQFSLTDDGNLTLYIADDNNADADIAITDGNLVLTEEDDETSQLENYSFTVTDEQNLTAEVSASST